MQKFDPFFLLFWTLYMVVIAWLVSSVWKVLWTS